ncbi:MAG: beta-phosphoglucomutase [Cyclobacteriaceae bacterium]
MILACIFDLDGVVVDTAKYHYLAWKRLANEMGFDFTESDNERLKGISRMRSLDILLEVGNVDLSEDEKLKAAERKNAWYVEYISKMNADEILPGVVDFIQYLRNDGIKIALGSASKNAPIILDQTKISGYFDAVIDGNTVSKAKPDPEVFLKGADALGLQPANCLVFEDAEAGVEAAINAGMYCVGVGSPDNLQKANLVIPGFANVNYNDLLNF